jgi:hypothetical protein
MDDAKHPLSSGEERWQTVIEECESLVAEYEDDGWTVTSPVPGDVVPVPAPGDSEVSKVGLDVLLSGAEFEQVESMVEESDFDEFEAYTGQEGGMVYASVLFKSTDSRRVFCLPLYYQTVDADRMLDRVRSGEQFHVYVHPLSADAQVQFGVEDPRPLFPPEDLT